jgi:hypothetical protein
MWALGSTPVFFASDRPNRRGILNKNGMAETYLVVCAVANKSQLTLKSLAAPDPRLNIISIIDR